VWVGVEWDGMRNDTGVIQPNFVLKRKENVPVHFPDDVVYMTSSMRSAWYNDPAVSRDLLPVNNNLARTHA
jgi:hypothetical protein